MQIVRSPFQSPHPRKSNVLKHHWLSCKLQLLVFILNQWKWKWLHTKSSSLQKHFSVYSVSSAAVQSSVGHDIFTLWRLGGGSRLRTVSPSMLLCVFTEGINRGCSSTCHPTRPQVLCPAAIPSEWDVVFRCYHSFGELGSFITLMYGLQALPF